MKKVVVTCSATIEKTLEISDEFFDKIKNDEFDYWDLMAEFERQGPVKPEIFINTLDGIEDKESGEMLFEY